MPQDLETHRLLDLALEQARLADGEGSVPVGCVVTDMHGNVRSRGRNRVLSGSGIAAHAEMNAITGLTSETLRESGWTIVTTAEPCLMCLGAIILGPFSTVVWATRSGSESAIAAVISSGYRADRLAEIVTMPEPSVEHRDVSRALLRRFYERIGEQWRTSGWVRD